MMKRHSYFSALIATLLCACISNAAHGDTKELVTAGKISWEGEPAVSWIGDGESQLLLKFTDTTPGACAFKLADGIKAQVRVVAVGGGGAGGVSHGDNIGAGGGGAGALIDSSLVLDGVSGGSSWAVTVGAGGACPAAYTTQVVGNNGNPSSFGSLVVAAGGGGGGAASAGNDGGCGGGGSKGAAAYVGGTGSVGFDGGKGSSAKYGAGGGGMGSAGKVSSAIAAGAGGDGVLNDITGEDLYYCGGGGGGKLATSGTGRAGGSGIGGAGGAADVAGPGVDGTGSGGGGSSSLDSDLGGKGGDGVVFVLVLEAVDVAVVKPVIEDVPYSGEDTAPFDFGLAYEYVSGVTNATVVGDYSFVVKPKEGFQWKDDGSTSNFTVNWKIVPLKINRPIAPVGLVYSGEEQVAAYDKPYYAFAVGSVVKATDAGVYSFTAVLNDKDNTCWDDGSTADLKVDWVIAAKAVMRPAIPSDLEYSGTNSVAFQPGEGYVYVSGETNSWVAGSFKYSVKLINPANATNYVWAGESIPAALAEITNEWSIASKKVDCPVAFTNLAYNGEVQNAYAKLETEYYTVLGSTNATAAGKYDVTFTLKNEAAQNYAWNVTPPTAENEWFTDWTIAKATNAVVNLNMIGWKLGTDPSSPSCDPLWGEDTVEYAYTQNLEEGPWESAAALTNGGLWYVRAVVPESDNWLAATNFTEFTLWDNPANIFINSVVIKIPGIGESRPIHQALIRLSPELIDGFDYEAAGNDGKELAFIDGNGDLMHYEVDTWNVNGESLLWLRLDDFPADGTTVTLYWGLRPKQSAPAYDCSDVWENYAGVWHMNEASGNAVNAAPTGSAYDGVPSGTYAQQMVGASGKIGMSRVNLTGRDEKAGSNGTRMLIPNYDDLHLGGVFTISGWFRAEKRSGYPRPFSRKNSYNESNGWEIQINNSDTQLQTRGSKDTAISYSVPYKVDYDWWLLTMVFSNNTAIAYINGEQQAKGTIVAATDNGKPMAIGNNSNGSEQAFRGRYDEVRLYPGAMSAAMIAADYAMADGTVSNEFGLVSHDGKKRNHWIKEPMISPTSWDVSSGEHGELIEPGQLAEGTVTNYYYDIYAPTNVYSDISQITEPGNYRAVFMQKETEGYEPISKIIDIRILTSEPYVDIRGDDGDSGRVLLMNNDKIKDGTTSLQINFQGYADIADTRGTYWDIPNEEGEEKQGTKSDLKQSGVTKPADVSCADFNIKVGRSSTLMKKDGSRLWHLEDCRHGNSYVFDPNGATLKENYALKSTQNYLPFSATSYDITVLLTRNTKAKRATAGQIVMRNRTTAAVYSPCFTNGFGTLYFDAVNGWAKDGVGTPKDGSGYIIAVQWATNAVNTTGESLLPLDENCYSVGEDGVTNWYSRVEWHDAEMISYKRDGTAEFSEPVRSTELPLAVVTGGSDQNFYRIAVPLNFDVPARIRIVRRSVDAGFRTADSDDKTTETVGYDNGGFVLLDNVIVSYPPMWAEMQPISQLDASRHGKQAIGYEISTSVPYPAVGEANAFMRAKPLVHINDGNKDIRPENFVASVKAHYRWRYLNQQFGEWKELDVNPTAEYTSVTPLEIPDEPGDIEYWLECGLEAPFYSYVDYTGLDIGIPYSEEIRAVTNHLGGAELASGGTDWFFRLRDGKSDRQGVKVAVEGALKGEYELALIGDSLWRGFIPNPTNIDGNCTFKFVGYNLQTPGSTEYATNTVVWGVNGGFTIKETPAAGKCEVGGDEIAFKVNHLANYYEVQFNEETLSWSFGSAEYQDFNQWTDAKGSKFVGNSAMGNRKGTAPTKKTYVEDFDTWAAMDAENKNWKLFSFADLNSLLGRTAYKQQASDTDEAWSIGPGMWVAKHYADQTPNANTAGVAYQLKGCGEGYVQYIEKDNCPRGVESISFNARLGQYINFTDFSFYDGDQKSKMTNYVFTTRGSFDWNENKSFAGNASLSAVAYYRESKGCYEVRWEQVKGNWNKKASDGGVCDGIDKYGQRLRLYRWYRDPVSGKVESTLLGTWENSKSKLAVASCTSYMGNEANAQPLMISVENTPSGTRIVAGVAAYGTFGNASTVDTTRNWYGICYLDTDAKRLTSGTYGLLSANCSGQFSVATSFKYAEPLTWSVFTDKEIGKAFENKKMTFPSGTPTACKADFDDDYWIVTPGRMKYVSDSAKGFLVASPAPQQLKVWTAPAGTMNWSLLKTVEVGNSFGAAAKPFDIKLYSTADCSVKISSGGEFDDPRNDVIIDSVVIRQFRGNDYSDKNEMTAPVPSPEGVQRIPGWNDPKEIHGMTNFIFTSAWIDNNAKRESGRILLSAKRAKKDKISGIRSPLLDGYYNRGRGLGMFAFDYADAQPNARLIVQIATNNVTYTDLSNYDDILAESFWQDFETIDFATKPKSGTISYYFGIHDKPAAVRVIVDPARVESLASTTDPTKFGDVYITKVIIRDEPAINDGCWTGWNLRMIASDVNGDSEKRMYLPDYADILEARGLSAALNNSATDGVDDPNDLTYRQNVPFVQTPIFGEGIVGEVSFKARTYGQNADQPANVRIYGSKVGGDMADGWVVVGDVEITNDVFTAYSYRIDTSKEFRAFRLGVTGAVGVNPPGPGPIKPDGYDRSVRVLLDEVVVSQAVQARVGFRRVGAFKSDIIGTEIVPNVPSREEQPLAMESWGVQCELYGAQQPDSIDFSHTPTVILHWYNENSPWGYDKWKDLPGAKSAYLRLATDSGVSNWVYRSSQRACPEAVIPMATESPTFVQYTLEVIFYTKDGDTPKTNWLTRAEWERPEWYDPVDFNAEHPDFAAFNILDNVAPGWAWINEVNIFGEFNQNLDNSDSKKQFIEIAQPPEAELYEWEVRLLEPMGGYDMVGGDMVVTNVLAVFGRNGFAAKKDAKYIDPTANMTFRTLANRAASTSGFVKTDDGSLDVIWKVEYPTALFSEEGVISAMYPFALQLVRGSGVVEHEIVVMGTNWWSDLPAAYRDRYHPTNVVNYLDTRVRNSDFLYVGKDDDAGLDRSLSVTNGNGSVAEQWTNLTVPTPGRINQWQYINPDHPIPSGENIIIYATVSGDYIVQRGEDGEFTDQMQMLTVRKGSLSGTNLLYRVDPWYVLGSITTNDVSAAGGVVRQGSTQPKFYELKVGVGCSNNVVVVAEAAPDPDFASKYGLDENDPYRPAVLDWLRNSRTANGDLWENVEDGNIYLADFITMNGTVTQRLSLKEMYYLDMDPTVTNQALIGGISEAPAPHYTTNGGEAVTNVRYGVYMMFTNRTEDVADTAHYGRHWTPYTLRGLEPGSLSRDYDADKDRWNGPTFKATGIMLNGKTSTGNPDNWMPLRYFVFKDDSFTPEGTAQLEIEDPYWHGSIGYNTGWGAYLEEYGWQMIGYFWSLDTRIRPAKIETLKTVNYYDE